jgi:hypothetical protein
VAQVEAVRGDRARRERGVTGENGDLAASARGFSMRRRKVLGMVAVTLAAVAVGAFVLWPRPDRITEENYDRIFREDVSRAEVESLLGPPGDYRTGLGESNESFSSGSGGLVFAHWIPDETAEGFEREFGKSDATRAVWVGDTYAMAIYFSSDRPLYFYSFKRRKLPQGPIDQLRWRAERLWRKWFPE